MRIRVQDPAYWQDQELTSGAQILFESKAPASLKTERTR